MTENIEDIRNVLSKPIVLIGMMGSGKTHMGRILANQLAWPFFDSDQLIEEKAGCSVSDIFELWGEQKFRDVEARTIQNLLDLKRTVVATGGGAILNPETAKKIFSSAHSVWVKADLDEIIGRVARNKNRPLLACENPEDVLKKLMKQRQPIYEQAQYSVDSSQKNDQAAISDLLHEMYDSVLKEAD